MGIIHKPHPDWASHIPILIKALETTDGPVLELGMGINSTPLLHILCADQGRFLDSYDTDGRFTDMFSNYKTANHCITLVENWDDWKWNHYGVALVDQKPAAARAQTVKQIFDTELIVLHDSQDIAEEAYGYEEIYPLFKYRYDYKKFPTWTTVLS